MSQLFLQTLTDSALQQLGNTFHWHPSNLVGLRPARGSLGSDAGSPWQSLAVLGWLQEDRVFLQPCFVSTTARRPFVVVLWLFRPGMSQDS